MYDIFAFRFDELWVWISAFSIRAMYYRKKDYLYI